MTAVTLDINDHEVMQALQRLAVYSQHLQPTLDAIGSTVANSILLNFREQHDPDGNPWQPLSEVTKEKRRQGSGSGLQILRDTGALAGSITHNASDYAVEIGTDLAYANMMQFGGTKAQFPHLWGDIPARPFIGLSEDDLTVILSIINHSLESSISTL